MPATSAIYQNKLSATDRGAALWYPEPHATGEVQLGDRDVGYISDGAFIRFFSLHPAPEPHYAVPAGYWTALPEPLPQYPNNAQVDIRERVIAPTALQSKGIVRTEIRAAATGNVAPGASAGVTVAYTCKEESGAMLRLRNHADSQMLYDTNRIRRWVRSQHASWVSYANEVLELDLKSEEVHFVRGWTKTSADWTVAAFTNSGCTLKLGLNANVTPAMGAEAHIFREQEDQGPAIHRDGVFVGSQRPLDARFDQCIFVKKYTVRPRTLRFLGEKLVANAEPQDLGRHPDDEGPLLPQEETMGVEVDYEPYQDDSRNCGLDASHIASLLDYILESSDAEVAIACEDDLDTLLLGMESPPRDMLAFLREMHPRVEVDEGGGGALDLNEIVIRRRKFNFANRTMQASPNVARTASEMTQAAELWDGKLLLSPTQSSASASTWPHLLFRHKNQENGVVSSVAISPAGMLLAAAWDDIAVIVWNIKDGLVYKILEEDGHTDSVWSIAFSPDGKHLVSGSSDTTALVWSLENGRPEHRLEGHEGDVTAVAYSPDGLLVCTGSSDGSIKIWDASTGGCLFNVEEYTSDIRHLLFSPDGTRLASCAESEVMLWDPRSGQKITTLEGHTGAVWSIAFSPQGDRLITGSEDHSSRVWDASNGDELVTLQEHTNSVWSVAFSPDGTEVATASYDCTVVTCDSFTGEHHHVFSDPEMSSIVEAVAYSPKHSFIASGAADGNVRVWNAKSGAFVAEYQGHEEKVKGVIFTPDGWDLVSYGEDGTIRVWSVLDAVRLQPA